MINLDYGLWIMNYGFLHILKLFIPPLGVRWLFLFLIFSNNLFSQNSSKKFIHITHQNAKHRVLAQFNDSISATEFAQYFLKNKHEEGFFKANFIENPQNPNTWHKDTLVLTLHLGEKYYWEKLKKGNLGFAEKIGFYERDFEKKVFSFEKIQKIQKNTLKFAENNGYPFAKIQLDSISFNNFNKNNLDKNVTDKSTTDKNTIYAVWKYEPERFCEFDTLKIIGKLPINRSFLRKYLGIRRFQPFDQSKITQIPRLLKQLPFLQLKETPSVTFVGKRAIINLPLEKRNANKFDGILGVLPNEQQGKTLITGEINLGLENLFSAGIRLYAQWQRLQTESQRLDLRYEHPLLFGFPFDAKGIFQLYKQDSSFVNRDLHLTLYYRLPNLARIGVSLENKQSGLGEKLQITNVNELPQVSESRWASYGLDYDWHNLDNALAPRQGTRIIAKMRWGQKIILKNPFWADSLYKNVPLNSLQTSANLRLEHYTSVQNHTFMGRFIGGYLDNNFLTLNDLFRVGGLQSLRGFNENTFFTSNYGIFTAEYRAYFGEDDSYFVVFYDQSILQTQTFNTQNIDYPFGIGVGLSFATRGGTFTLAYALGKSKDQDFGLSRAKIHLGIVSNF